MKQKISIMLAVVLAALCCTGALADELNRADVFGEAYMREHGLNGEDSALSCRYADWDGDTLYVCLSDMSVYTWTMGGAPQKLCTLPMEPKSLGSTQGAPSDQDIAQLHETVTGIAAHDGQLFGYNAYSGGWGAIDENGIHWKENHMDFSRLFHEDNFYADRVVRSFMTDEALVTLVQRWNEYWEQEYAVCSFDLNSGESKEYAVEGICGACRGAEGELLLLIFKNDAYSLAKLDLIGGTAEDVPIAVDMEAEEGTFGGLAYDAERDAIYLCAGGKIYVSLQGQRFEPMAEMNLNYISTDSSAWALPGGRYGILSDGIHVRGEGAVDEHHLTIAGGLQMEAMTLFQRSYPDVIMTFKDEADAETLATGIATQDDTVDVYVLRADYTFATMKDKQLAASLSASERIEEDVSAMDASIQQVLRDAQGHVVAYPAELMLYYYGVNEGYWHMFWPDRPLPETFDDVLDAWIDFEQNIAQDYPGLGFIGYDFDYAEWVETLIRAYVMQHDTGELPDLTAPSLRSALEKLSQVAEIRAAQGRPIHGEIDPQIESESETGPAFIFRDTLGEPLVYKGPAALIYDEDRVYGQVKGDFTQRQLHFDEETLNCTDGRMNIYVVNPYTRHMEDALHFIECMTEIEVAPRLYYALHPDMNEPLEDTNYEATRTRYTESRDMYAESIATAQANHEDTSVLEAQLRYYDAWLNEDGYRWLIAPETLSEYRRMVAEKPLNVHAESPYIAASDTTTQQIIRTACSRYAEGNISLDAMLKEISDKVRMIWRENQ